MSQISFFIYIKQLFSWQLRVTNRPPGWPTDSFCTQKRQKNSRRQSIVPAVSFSACVSVYIGKKTCLSDFRSAFYPPLGIFTTSVSGRTSPIRRDGIMPSADRYRITYAVVPFCSNLLFIAPLLFCMNGTAFVEFPLGPAFVSRRRRLAYADASERSSDFDASAPSQLSSIRLILSFRPVSFCLFVISVRDRYKYRFTGYNYTPIWSQSGNKN